MVSEGRGGGLAERDRRGRHVVRESAEVCSWHGLDGRPGPRIDEQRQRAVRSLLNVAVLRRILVYGVFCILDFDKVIDIRYVYVVGDFNSWALDDNSRLERRNNLDWHKSVTLKPGKYRYKFVVDGLYFEDPVNSHKEPNPYGNSDSVFEI